FVDGDRVAYKAEGITGSGSELTGLDPTGNTLYRVVKVDDANFKLVTETIWDANGGHVTQIADNECINVSGGEASSLAGVGGLHTFTPTGAAASGFSGNTITMAGHGFTNGAQVRYTVDGTALAGLANNGLYRVVVVNDDSFRLVTEANWI